jgi:hypothetical protein
MQALNTPVSPAVDTATMRMIFPGVPVRKMVTIPQTIEANIVIVEIIAIAREIVSCTLDRKSHDVSEFYEFYKNRLLCEIYLCTVVKTIVFESISRSGLPNNSKFEK